MNKCKYWCTECNKTTKWDYDDDFENKAYSWTCIECDIEFIFGEDIIDYDDVEVLNRPKEVELNLFG